MLGGSFFGKNGGRAASGVVAAEKKNLFFFLRSFPERMFREVNGVLSLTSTLRGTKKTVKAKEMKSINE
jgi:hypothetical protein